MESLDVLGKRAKAASRQMAKFKITKKNEVLEMVADELIKKADEIKKANKADVDEAVKNGMKPALIDRLTLTDARIEGMAEGLRQLVALEDPVGEITSMKQRPNGLMIGYKKVPLGVITIIYESRPNVTVDAFGLTFKSGNAVILRGGSDSINSNIKLVEIIRDTLNRAGVCEDAVILISDTDRKYVNELMKMNEYVEHCETKKWRKQIAEWKEEHPLTMKNRVDMGPQDIIEEINRQFDNAIIATDVGQHQMFTTQYIEITKNKQLITSGGLGTMGYGFPAAIGAKLGNPDKDVIAISGDGGMQMNIQEFATAVLEELPLILCVFNNEYLGMVRQWQKLFYGKRYSMTNLKSGALFRRTNGQEMPEYTPDFVKLAESYGAKGIRVMKKEDIAAAFEEAKKNTKTPTLIEFVINPEELVYPMVQPGGTLEDLIMDC